VALPEPSAPLDVGEEVGQARVGGHIAHATDGASAPAAAIAFLASNDAAWITGHTLPVDGELMTGARPPESQADALPGHRASA
jgi:NAD(P)-dependent dehydrogenase (short-subunit alcohol dehydrogenase family)